MIELVYIQFAYVPSYTYGCVWLHIYKIANIRTRVWMLIREIKIIRNGWKRSKEKQTLNKLVWKAVDSNVILFTFIGAFMRIIRYLREGQVKRVCRILINRLKPIFSILIIQYLIAYNNTSFSFPQYIFFKSSFLYVDCWGIWQSDVLARPASTCI